MGRLKHKYNKWLYLKFGSNAGTHFENIPIAYRLNPLFSPAIYILEMGRNMADGFAKGWVTLLNSNGKKAETEPPTGK